MHTATHTTLKCSDPAALEAIPKPEEIREQIVRVSEQGRLLRSLYRLARRIEDSKREEAHVG